MATKRITIRCRINQMTSAGV